MADPDTRTVFVNTDQGAASTDAGSSSDTTSYGATVTVTRTESQNTNTGLPGFSIGSASTSTVSESIITPGFTSTTAVSAAAAQTTNPSTTSSSSSNGGYSTGAIAGAAVGSAIGAALLAFLVTFFLCGRRGRSGRSQHRNVSHTGFSEKGSKSTLASAWQAYLPQAADDGSLRNAVKTLFDQIELHVDNFYHAGDVRWDANTSQAVRQIGSGKLPAPIEELLQTPRTALAAIKHCIAFNLVTSISPSSRPELSLLPARMAALPPKLQGAETSSSRDSIVARQAYGQWKLLNTFLFPNTTSDPSYKMDRDVTASDVAELLCSTFLPWQKRSVNPETAKQNAKGLASTAADLGVLVMSQAAIYDFNWNTGSSRSEVANAPRNSLVTFPGFSKVADEQGKMVQPPQVLLSPDVLKM